MKKVLLLSMPFGALDRQALGLSLLKARLTEADIACDIRYMTFAFAELIGYDDYQWMSFDVPYTAFAGDWCFTGRLFGEDPQSVNGYVQNVLRGTWHLNEAQVARILRVRSLTGYFLDHCMAAIPWQEYTLVGFTSTFEQNIASLALARRIKVTHPEITTVFGGANWEADMGVELHRGFAFVDYACSGEADDSFPALVSHVLRDRRSRGLGSIAGIVYRSNGETVASGPPNLIQDVDRLAIPDYTDYFRDVQQSTIGADIVPTLLLETSRGCWWGAKSHCTFCGLNGGSMTYRSKSPGRVVDEIEYLVERWRIPQVEVVDNILDMKYFNDVLPTLASAHRPVQLFYEVKANLTRKHVQLLREAGVMRIQPGIESMSDHVLKLMRKGTTALRNIQLLKWCKEYGIVAEWNILYGFPGETRADYAAMLDLLPSIRFLRPPTACGPIRLDRFSPFFDSPEDFGFLNVRPLAPYTYLYPFDQASLSRIAYYFDFDYAPGVDPTGYAQDVIAYTAEWQTTPETGALASTVTPDGRLVLIDKRSTATLQSVALSGALRVAYEFCDSLRAGPAVAQHLRECFPDTTFDNALVLDSLESLVANRLMVTDGHNYLSLAIPIQPLRVTSGAAGRSASNASRVSDR
jgi:ribosomal peptide maturation radical SAM protein 1